MKYPPKVLCHTAAMTEIVKIPSALYLRHFRVISAHYRVKLYVTQAIQIYSFIVSHWILIEVEPVLSQQYSIPTTKMHSNAEDVASVVSIVSSRGSTYLDRDMMSLMSSSGSNVL